MSDILFFFKRIIEYEYQLEKLKQELYFRPDFNIFDLFNFIDRENKGYLTNIDLENGFSEMNIEISGKGNRLFFKKFDKANFLKLKFIDFSKAFIPILMNSQALNERRSINKEMRFDYKEVKTLFF